MYTTLMTINKFVIRMSIEKQPFPFPIFNQGILLENMLNSPPRTILKDRPICLFMSSKRGNDNALFYGKITNLLYEYTIDTI